MPVPKYRKSKSRVRTRRSHQSLVVPQYAECPRCHHPVLPHCVCDHCGHYAGREVFKKEEE